MIKQDGSPQSQIPKRRIDLGIAGRKTYRASIHVVGDQNPQLPLIDSAGKRDTILRGHRSRCNQIAFLGRALCGLHASILRSFCEVLRIGLSRLEAALRHAENYVAETLPNTQNSPRNLDLRVRDSVAAVLVYILPPSRPFGLPTPQQLYRYGE